MPRSEGQLDYVKRLTGIGIALSAEKDLDRLMALIVDEARKLTDADGGSLYVVSDDHALLRFAIIQNDTLGMRLGGTEGQIAWAPVLLQRPDGTPNYANVCAYGALSGQVVSIPDVYDAQGFDFEGTREFDAQTGFRSKSMLVVPLRNHEDVIIGVLQLLNAQDRLTGEVVPFSPASQEITESLASQAAVALTNNRLIQEIERLFESFITAIATAIDEKSPYTGGHVRRVAALTMATAEAINGAQNGPYAGIRFTEDELNELRIAAWLHDLGKVTTPEYVVNKATKLETIYDRIESVRLRFELLKKDLEIAHLKRQLAQTEAREETEAARRSLDKAIAELDAECAFLAQVNSGREAMTEEEIERVRAIAKRTFLLTGGPEPLLSEEELHNLGVRHGTLTDEERETINKHAALTYSMLSQLPFPSKLQNVPLYAEAHHEKLDGSGYPLGLKGDQLPLQSRILALADIFEALTAKDRPYRQGMTLREAIHALEDMVSAGHLDADLFRLFVKEGIHLQYGARESIPS